MEDILETYMRPYDPQHPLVCMDETTKQPIKETRVPIPMKPGSRNKCHDHEYERNGISNLFMFFSPTEKSRHVKVTDRRTKTDWAQAMKELADEQYSGADLIPVVMDNLNTHGPTSFYEAFEPEKKPDAYLSDLTSTTLPSMAAGSTWPKQNSAFFHVSAWPAQNPGSANT